jgi:hypothetical protein
MCTERLQIMLVGCSLALNSTKSITSSLCLNSFCMDDNALRQLTTARIRDHSLITKSSERKLSNCGSLPFLSECLFQHDVWLNERCRMPNSYEHFYNIYFIWKTINIV